MALNQISTNFYCSKDNAFDHYVKQKFVQKNEQQTIIKQLNPTNHQTNTLRNPSLNIQKSHRYDKSITNLVQFPNSAQFNHNINQYQSIQFIKAEQANVKQKNNTLSPVMNARSRLALNNNSIGILNKKQNISYKNDIFQQLTDSQQILKQSFHQSNQSESNTIQLVLPSKYFNSPTSKHSQSQKNLTKKNNSKMIQDIFSQPLTQSGIKNKQTLTESGDNNDQMNNRPMILNQRVIEIGANNTPRNKKMKQNLSHQFLNVNLVQSPSHAQLQQKKVKLHKNYYLQKFSQQQLKGIEDQSNSEIERSFTSPFGDAQFDLVPPSFSNYSQQIDSTEFKSTPTKVVNSSHTLTQNKHISEGQSNSPQNRDTKKNNNQSSQQSRFSEQIKIHTEKKQVQNKQNMEQQDYNLINENYEQKNLTLQIKDNSLISNDKLSSRFNSHRELASQNEIAYDRFTLNKQILKQDQLKKKDDGNQNTETVNNNNYPKSARRNQNSDSIENIKAKQLYYAQTDKKKSQKSSQLSRALSSYNEEINNSQNYLNTQDYQNINTVQLPSIKMDYKINVKNSKSMSEIIMVNNERLPASLKHIELPPINQSQAEFNLNPSLPSLQNIIQEPKQVYQRSKQRKQTDVLSIDFKNKKQNKFSRQMTLDPNNKFFENQFKTPLNEESNNPNYYQAFLALSKQNIPNSKSQIQIPSRSQAGEQNEISKEEQKERKNAKIKRNQSMVIQFEKELIESIRYLKILISNDDQMKVFIRTFCFIEVEEFCFLFGIFLDSIYDIQADQSSSTPTNAQLLKIKSKQAIQSVGIVNSQRLFSLPNENTNKNTSQGSMTNMNENGNEQQILTHSIKLPEYGLNRIEHLLKQSFLKSNISDIEEKLDIYRESKRLLLPDNLLDEIGGRVLIERIFVSFLEELILSKEFLRDSYEEQYDIILNKIKNSETKSAYIQIICEFLKDNSDSVISDYVKEKILALKIQLSSIDFFVLKKRLYHFLLNQDLVITKDQILKIISRLNQLRQVICNDVLFIRNPENLERHIFLSLKSFLISTHFLKSVSTQSLVEITNKVIKYITFQITPNSFIEYLQSVVQEENFSTFLNSLEFLSTQAFEIYSYLSVEDRADLKYKFQVVRQKLGFEKYISQVLPVPLPVILSDLSEWVKTQITDEPLPKEILLKNLENTELLEIIIEFSHPDIYSFSYHDSFAAFSFYNFTKVQYMFWVKGFLSILTNKYKVFPYNIEIAEKFLKLIFPDRQNSKESNFKLNKQSEDMYNEQFQSASQQKIKINLPQQNNDQSK